jgi:hypothetical protein
MVSQNTIRQTLFLIIINLQNILFGDYILCYHLQNEANRQKKGGEKRDTNNSASLKFAILAIIMRYYVPQNHNLATKTQKQLIYNYCATIPWVFITNFMGTNNYVKIMGTNI